MPARSEKQRKLFQMVEAFKKGDLKNPSSEVQKIAGQVTAKEAHKFGSEKIRKK